MLMTEAGRFRNMQLSDRICPLCGEGLENETHFLFTCSKYSVERSVFVEGALLINNRFLEMNIRQKLACVMSSEVVYLTVNYIHTIFNKRQSLVYNC